MPWQVNLLDDGEPNEDMDELVQQARCAGRTRCAPRPSLATPAPRRVSRRRIS